MAAGDLSVHQPGASGRVLEALHCSTGSRRATRSACSAADSATRLAALPLGNTTRPGNPRPNRIPPLQLDALRDPAQPTRGPNRDPVAVPEGGASGGELSSGSPPDQSGTVK